MQNQICTPIKNSVLIIKKNCQNLGCYGKSQTFLKSVAGFCLKVRDQIWQEKKGFYLQIKYIPFPKNGSLSYIDKL